MNTTPQERMALGVFALLVSLGVGARMLHRPGAVELTGSTPAADSAAFQALPRSESSSICTTGGRAISKPLSSNRSRCSSIVRWS